jgi:hypothetical protein
MTKGWTVGSALAVATTIATVWGAMHSDLVPVTRAQHVADLDKIVEILNKNQAEWRCDEYSEELAELLAIEDRTDAQDERIRVLRNLMSLPKNKCERFES